MVRVEDLVGPHQRYEVFGLAQIDYVVCISRQHVHGLDICLALCFVEACTCLACLEVDAQLAFLDQPMAAYYDEELPLAVVPALALRDFRLQNVYGELDVVCGLERLGE